MKTPHQSINEGLKKVYEESEEGSNINNSDNNRHLFAAAWSILAQEGVVDYKGTESYRHYLSVWEEDGSPGSTARQVLRWMEDNIVGV
jgi:hypothetical protein